jgi:hypothetical protein
MMTGEQAKMGGQLLTENRVEKKKKKREAGG